MTYSGNLTFNFTGTTSTAFLRMQIDVGNLLYYTINVRIKMISASAIVPTFTAPQGISPTNPITYLAFIGEPISVTLTATLPGGTNQLVIDHGVLPMDCSAGMAQSLCMSNNVGVSTVSRTFTFTPRNLSQTKKVICFQARDTVTDIPSSQHCLIFRPGSRFSVTDNLGANITNAAIWIDPLVGTATRVLTVRNVGFELLFWCAQVWDSTGASPAWLSTAVSLDTYSEKLDTVPYMFNSTFPTVANVTVTLNISTFRANGCDPCPIIINLYSNDTLVTPVNATYTVISGAGSGSTGSSPAQSSSGTSSGSKSNSGSNSNSGSSGSTSQSPSSTSTASSTSTQKTFEASAAQPSSWITLLAVLLGMLALIALAVHCIKKRLCKKRGKAKSKSSRSTSHKGPRSTPKLWQRPGRWQSRSAGSKAAKPQENRGRALLSRVATTLRAGIDSIGTRPGAGRHGHGHKVASKAPKPERPRGLGHVSVVPGQL